MNKGFAGALDDRLEEKRKNEKQLMRNHSLFASGALSALVLPHDDFYPEEKKGED